MVSNGESKFKIGNTQPQTFSRVKLYTSRSNPFSSKLGIICNVRIVNCATASNRDDGFCDCTIAVVQSQNPSWPLVLKMMEIVILMIRCLGSLYSGSNNCLASINFDSDVDCCYPATRREDHFSTSGISCRRWRWFWFSIMIFKNSK